MSTSTRELLPLYPETRADGSTYGVVTNSMIKTFRRCPKQTQYKYAERLKTPQTSKPLARGKWMHSLLEAHYKGQGWLKEHLRLCDEFAGLFDEEKDALGDLPNECRDLMKAYLWHYGANKADPMHGWEVLDVELTIEVDLPDGDLYRGRADMLVRNEYGLWLVDHKTHKRLPDLGFRIRDVQSVLYVWALRQQGLEVEGFIWNYIKTVPPSTPAVVDKGKRLSRSKCVTDYPTMLRTIKNAGLNPEDYRGVLTVLKNDRWAEGKTQTSPFFLRETLERDDDMIERVLAEFLHSKDRMDNYPWDQTDAIERVPEASCTFMCSYKDLCTAELFGDSTGHLRRKVFKPGADPMDYYKEEIGKED